jgi:hypothetical protein
MVKNYGQTLQNYLGICKHEFNLLFVILKTALANLKVDFVFRGRTFSRAKYEFVPS